jgi:hypothetical protein
MHRTIMVVLFLFMGTASAAQTIALSGNVTDKNGRPLSGAIVSLALKKLSAVTNASGAYSITGGTNALHHGPMALGAEAISLTKGVFMVSLLNPAPVRIELFDMRGNLVARALDNPSSAGNYRFDMTKLRLAANMTLIRVSIGQRATSFRYLPLNEGKCEITTSMALLTLAKVQATVDTLQASASHYTTKKVPISSYEATADIALDTSVEVVGNCTPSKPAGVTVSGSGPHKVTVETNSDPGIKEGTIYRPTDLGPGKNYPIFAWGEGGCSLDGKSNSVAMGEIASHGYFVIADGTPGGSSSRSMNSSDPAAMGKPLLAYITWVIAENRKPCSAYYQSLDTTKIAANGFSCGGLMAEGTAGDSRITTWGLNSSGLFSANQAFYKTIHTPALIVLGDSSDIAYANGERDYENISTLANIPVMLFSKKGLGHGGDLFKANGGDFTRIDLAWLNWWLKGDEEATGKGALVGSGCAYCIDKAWEVKWKNIP